MDVVSKVELVHLFHLEGFTVWYSEIIAILDHLDVVHQTDELSIVFIILEGRDWNAVGKLSSEAVDCVIYDNQILKITTFEDPQIFNVNVIVAFDAMVSVESMLDQLPLWIYIVEDGVCIPLVTCSEDDDFEIFVNHLKAFFSVGTDVEPSLQNLS